MKFNPLIIVSLLFAHASLFSPTARAAAPVGEVTQLSGFVMALKPNGALKLLSTKSLIEAGDVLVSENNTYVRIDLADGQQAVLGPRTRLKITSTTTLSLATGQLQLLAPAVAGNGRLTIEAGDSTIDAGAASFNLFYTPDPATALARRAYAQASLAAAPDSVHSDAGTLPQPIWEKIAQGVVPPAPRPGLAPGLYVQVLDGAIKLSNSAGSSNFSAGQFGYTHSVGTPPVMVPQNPAIRFTPPPMFVSTTNSPGRQASAGPTGVDCEVR